MLVIKTPSNVCLEVSDRDDLSASTLAQIVGFSLVFFDIQSHFLSELLCSALTADPPLSGDGLDEINLIIAADVASEYFLNIYSAMKSGAG